MKPRANFAPFRSPRSGFSLVELLLSLAVLLVLTTLAVPVVVRSLQGYQLNSSASQLAGLVKFTKFEAIRQNTPVSLQIAAQGTNWLVWVDSNGNLQADGSEPRMIVGGNFTLLPAAAVPSPASIAGTLGPGGNSIPWTVVSGAAGSLMYDQRGVSVDVDGSGRVVDVTSVYVLYLGGSVNPALGYRAIVRLPSGAVQVWTAGSLTDTWQRVS